MTVKYCSSTQVYEGTFKGSSNMEKRSKKYILFIIIKREKHNDYTMIQFKEFNQNM